MIASHALRERARLVAELHDIVRAMKNLAFAQLQHIAREQPALQQAVDAVDAALAEIGTHDGTTSASTPACWLAIGAERGFCGAFNAHLAHAVRQLRHEQPDALVWVAGRRLAERLADTGPGLQELPGCTSLEDAPAVLPAWLDALGARLSPGSKIDVLHHGAGGVQRARVWPTPPLERSISGPPPSYHLPLPALRAALGRQAFGLRLRAALHASLHEESRWRLNQMQRAQDHLQAMGRELQRRGARQRQAEITNELETLASASPDSDVVPR